MDGKDYGRGTIIVAMIYKTFYIKPNERGLLYHRSDFKKILRPGNHTLWGWHWRVVTYDLNHPQAQIENLELLLQSHGALLQQHFTIVRTGFNEAALVRLGQTWQSLGPNQLRAFWRGFVEVEVEIFNLDESLELPAPMVQRLRGVALDGLRKAQITEAEMGLLYVQDNFVRPLEPGDYAFWTFSRNVSVRSLSRLVPDVAFPDEEVLRDRHPDFVATHCETVQLAANQVAIVRHKGKAIAILPPSSRRLFWQGVNIEIIDLSTDFKLSPRLIAELVSGLPDVLNLSHRYLEVLEVPSQHMGLLHLDGVLQDPLSAGWHAWWTFGHAFKTEIIDLRLQTLEISGQEILTKDKVPLRLNLTAGYKVTHPIQAKGQLADIGGFLYKELQFGLRAAVGTKTLDALLEDKGAVDRSIADYMREKTAGYGLEIESVGVKDIILPGEIKTILSKVVEAEKAAQANVVRRREETAATRSMLNTARVMEDNPVALRLKELEVLERIAEKIDHIQVNGLDNILTDLIRIKEPNS